MHTATIATCRRMYKCCGECIEMTQNIIFRGFENKNYFTHKKQACHHLFSSSIFSRICDLLFQLFLITFAASMHSRCETYCLSPGTESEICLRNNENAPKKRDSNRLTKTARANPNGSEHHSTPLR